MYSERQSELVEKSNKQAWERMLSLSVMMKIDNSLLYVNGKEQTSDVAPLILNNRTFLPLRIIGEGLVGTVSYDDATQTVTILRNGKTVNLTIGIHSIAVDGNVTEIDAAPFIENSRTMVPVRAIAEGFGMNVHYDNGLILVTEDAIDTEHQVNIIADMHKKFDYVPEIPSNVILVEAEAFSDMGGWVLDQQGMDLMGSPYLMTHGLKMQKQHLKPRKPAITVCGFAPRTGQSFLKPTVRPVSLKYFSTAMKTIRFSVLKVRTGIGRMQALLL